MGKMVTLKNGESVYKPSMAEIMESADDGTCEAVCPEGCIVETDGTCEHGRPSWMLLLGLI